jgi:hypothetical protein
MYPEYALIDGVKYKINTDYKVALKCIEISEDYEISDYERCLAIVYKLFGIIPEADLLEAFLKKAQLFLQCGQTVEEQNTKEADMDFLYDRKYINASFYSDYGIDIEHTKMHFWQYVELIEGFTDKAIMSRIRQIRTCNVRDYAEKDRNAIREAKRQVALPRKKTKEEQAMEDEFWASLGGE